MASGLGRVSFSLPEWRAVKMIFFAPCNVEMHTFYVDPSDQQLPHIGNNKIWSLFP